MEPEEGRKEKMAINGKLKYLRRKKGWTIKRLSDETGISTVSISKYENGHAVPGVLSLQRLSEALGCSFEELASASVE